MYFAAYTPGETVRTLELRNSRFLQPPHSRTTNFARQEASGNKASFGCRTARGHRGEKLIWGLLNAS